MIAQQIKYRKSQHTVKNARGAVVGPIVPPMGFLRQLASIGNGRLKVKWNSEHRKWGIWEQIPQGPAEIVLVSSLSRLDNRVIAELDRRCMMQWASKKQAYNSLDQEDRDELSREEDAYEEAFRVGMKLTEEFYSRMDTRVPTAREDRLARKSHFAGLNDAQRRELGRLEGKFR